MHGIGRRCLLRGVDPQFRPVLSARRCACLLAVDSVRLPDAREVLCCVQAVGTRACYLFSRLVRSLRQNMRPLLSDILLRLQPHLAHILASPLPEAEPAAKGAAPLCSSLWQSSAMQPCADSQALDWAVHSQDCVLHDGWKFAPIGCLQHTMLLSPCNLSRCISWFQQSRHPMLLSLSA